MTPEERLIADIRRWLRNGQPRLDLSAFVGRAIREAEQSAFERAAKVAEEQAAFRAVGDGEIWIANKIAQSIRDLAKQKA